MTGEGNYMTGRDREFERRRLASQATIFDARTFEELGSIGVSEGWHCLELGAGTGTIARWLLDRVGPTGHVVAIDLDTTALAHFEASNLETREGDATAMDLGMATFDLIAARLFFEHVSEREILLDRCVRALKPGGWLWLWDADYSNCHATGSLAIDDRWATLSTKVYPFGPTAGQTDVRWASRLVDVLDGRGLERVHSVRLERVMPAGSPAPENLRMIVRQRINQLPAPSGEDLAAVEDAMTLFDDPALRLYPAAAVSAWGRKPS